MKRLITKRLVTDSMKTGGWIMLVLSGIGVVAILLGLFSSHDMLFQSVAVLLSVMVTAIVTGALLESQTSGEEKREMNIKIYENKIAVYSRFITKMWGVLADNRPVSTEQMMALRKELFNQLVFYVDDTLIDKIAAQFEPLANIENAEINNNAAYRKAFAAITAILHDDIAPKTANKNRDVSKEEYTKRVSHLWSSFGSSDEESPVTEITVEQTSVPAPATETTDVNTVAIRRIDRCIHFGILDTNYQKQLYDNRANTDDLVPLFLCEYDESWRTNFIKTRIQANDIILLFQRGGAGYVGAFMAKKYVVFESTNEGIKCEIHDYVSNKTTIIDKGNEVNELMDLYKAKEMTKDGATYYSYLLGEPIVVYKDFNSGVGSISIYRRTVSSYAPQYAWLTLSRFKTAVDENNADVYVSHHLFDRLEKEHHITAAKKDATGGWKY